MYLAVVISFHSSAFVVLFSLECHENIGAQPRLILPENSPTLCKGMKSERKEPVTSETFLASRSQWKKGDPEEAPICLFPKHCMWLERRDSGYSRVHLLSRFSLIGSWRNWQLAGQICYYKFSA
jgi:hypothetical protein